MYFILSFYLFLLFFEFGNRFIDVHFLAVPESDDKGVFELCRNGALRTQHLVIIGGGSIRIFVYSPFLIIIYLFQSFQPFVVFCERLGRSKYLYLKRNFTVIGCTLYYNWAFRCCFCCRGRFCFCFRPIAFPVGELCSRFRYPFWAIAGALSSSCSVGTIVLLTPR